MPRIDIQLDIAGAYGRGILRGVMDYANIRGNWAFIMPPLYLYSLPRAREAFLSVKTSADGVIGMLHEREKIAQYHAAKIPVVNTARTLSSSELRELRLTSVLPDDAEVGRLAFNYFWDKRFHSFAFCGHPTAAWSRVRLQAFAAECEKKGVFFDQANFIDGKPPEQWMIALPKPCALLVGNDHYAWEAIEACHNNGISVPQDIAVLGVDNDMFLTQMVRPNLSSIDLGPERLGYEAARILDGMMRGEKEIPEIIELPPSGVVTRHSTDVLSITDEVVAEALQFIRDHAAEPIGVEDVLRQVAMSRRNLERRFRKVMRRSLHDEILRIRLDRAAQLLRDTGLDIFTIAEQSGFASHVRFSTVFRERMGMTPTVYRRRYYTGSA